MLCQLDGLINLAHTHHNKQQYRPVARSVNEVVRFSVRWTFFQNLSRVGGFGGPPPKKFGKFRMLRALFGGPIHSSKGPPNGQKTIEGR